MDSRSRLEKLLAVPAERESLEFKEAQEQFDTNEFLRYCVALANEGGGCLVLGVTDRVPRRVVGTKAFGNLNKLKKQVLDKIHVRIEAQECLYDSKRVLIFQIPSRPTGQALSLNGSFLMRSGESLVAMTGERLKAIFAEDAEVWLEKIAVEDLDTEQVIDLLDTQTFFRLLKLPYPEDETAVLSRIMGEGLVKETGDKWEITNMGAILLAKDLRRFPHSVSRKAPRFIVYDGKGKTRTREDLQDSLGYAVGFENLIEYIDKMSPQNRIIEETVRNEVKMFPPIAIRELVANALIHQDFSVAGASVMIEMYSDRLEISNPGVPPIETERFIDEYKSRNETLADIMRRLGFCEEKGSGVDKVVQVAEAFQLPAPDFKTDTIRTIAKLFAYRDFSDMDRENRVRACYQHCCLRYVFNEKMTNATLRERFKLGDDKMATVSQIISATRDKGLIKSSESETMSTRHARYVPYWA